MLEYKCPCCDGAIQFDSTTQKMKCPYCDTEFEVDALKGYDEDLKDQKPSEMNWACTSRSPSTFPPPIKARALQN